jgi:hypothetical protein
VKAVRIPAWLIRVAWVRPDMHDVGTGDDDIRERGPGTGLEVVHQGRAPPHSHLCFGILHCRVTERAGLSDGVHHVQWNGAQCGQMGGVPDEGVLVRRVVEHRPGRACRQSSRLLSG